MIEVYIRILEGDGKNFPHGSILLDDEGQSVRGQYIFTFGKEKLPGIRTVQDLMDWLEESDRHEYRTASDEPWRTFRGELVVNRYYCVDPSGRVIFRSPTLKEAESWAEKYKLTAVNRPLVLRKEERE